MMINKNLHIKCLDCKSKDEGYEIILGNKKYCLCENCFKNFYTVMGKMVLPKSPTSILKKDNKVKIERF